MLIVSLRFDGLSDQRGGHVSAQQDLSLRGYTFMEEQDNSVCLAADVPLLHINSHVLTNSVPRPQPASRGRQVLARMPRPLSSWPAPS